MWLLIKSLKDFQEVARIIKIIKKDVIPLKKLGIIYLAS